MVSKLPFVVIFLLLVTVAILAYRNYQLMREIPAYWPRTTSALSTPTPFDKTGLPSDWQTFTSFKNVYTFRYPGDVNIEEFQDTVRATRKDTQNNSAGIFIEFRLGSLPEGIDLKTYIEQQIETAKGGGEVTSPLTQILVHSYNSYMYGFKGLGAEKHYYIPNLDGQTFMHIIDSTADSSAQDFKGTADSIVQTFFFTQ